MFKKGIKKDILKNLEEIKKSLEIVHMRLDGIENDIYSMKTWMCGFDSATAIGEDKSIQQSENMNEPMETTSPTNT